MKKQIGTVVAGAIAGVFVFSIWGMLVEAHGVGAGWFAGLWIIGIAWFVNHYVGATYNPDGGMWIDMALAIGVAGTMNGVFRGKPITAALPTFFWVAVGAALGGYFAAKVNESLSEREELEDYEEADIEQIEA